MDYMISTYEFLKEVFLVWVPVGLIYLRPLVTFIEEHLKSILNETLEDSSKKSSEWKSFGMCMKIMFHVIESVRILSITLTTKMIPRMDDLNPQITEGDFTRLAWFWFGNKENLHLYDGPQLFRVDPVFIERLGLSGIMMAHQTAILNQMKNQEVSFTKTFLNKIEEQEKSYMLKWDNQENIFKRTLETQVQQLQELVIVKLDQILQEMRESDSAPMAQLEGGDHPTAIPTVSIHQYKPEEDTEARISTAMGDNSTGTEGPSTDNNLKSRRNKKGGKGGKGRR